MYILTPDVEANQMVNLVRFDYLSLEPYDEHRYALIACTNCGFGAILKISRNLSEMKVLQNCIETSERCERYSPTTATLH